MKRFRFSLARVLEWQQMKVQMHENAIHRITTDLNSTGQALDRLRGFRTAAARSVAAGPARGSDLERLSNYYGALASQELATAARRTQIQQDLANERSRLLEAKRREKLLNRVRERRWGEYEYDLNRRIESEASDVWLARWKQKTSGG
jgi:flagellar biosynthesis chaperone FliJ